MERRVAQGVVLGCVIFCACVVVAGLLNPGYSHTRDWLSVLAGRGSESSWIGAVAIFGYASACACAAALWQRRNPIASAALVLAVLAGGVAGLARLDCSGGVPGCHVQDGLPNTFDEDLHNAGIAVFAFCLLVAMLAIAVTLGRGRSDLGWRPWLTVLSVASAVGGLIALDAMTGSTPGTPQRVWVGLTIVWLCVVATAPGRARSAAADGAGRRSRSIDA